MPILYQPTVLPPVKPTALRSHMLRYTLSTGNDSIDLVPANGIYPLPGFRGLDMPDVVTNEEQPIGWDGGISNPSQFEFREISLLLEIRSIDGTQDGLQAMVDRLTQMFNARRTTMRLTVAHADGRTRWIEGRYSGGFNADMVAGAGQWRQPMQIVMRCPDPYWAGDQQKLIFAKDNVSHPFLGVGFLPLRLNESAKLGDQHITVLGNAEAFPVWRVHGPGTSFSATDETTGFSWVLGDLGEDDEVVLNATRGIQTVTKNGGNAWQELTTGSALWPLQPGNSTITLAIEEIEAGSVIELTYIPRYLTVWNR